MKFAPIIPYLFAGVVLVAGWVVAADSIPALRSPAAKAAIVRADKACDDADALARRTKVNAKKQLVVDLQKAQREVLAGGNLDEANAIKALIDRTALEIKQLAVKTPDDAVRFHGNRYKLSTQSVTWDAARKMCEDAGGQLVVINSAEEEKFLTNYASQKEPHIWIGLHRVGDKWICVDGSTPAYTSWMGGEPNNSSGSEYYVEMRQDGWNDVYDMKLPFICEWPNIDN